MAIFLLVSFAHTVLSSYLHINSGTYTNGNPSFHNYCNMLVHRMLIIYHHCLVVAKIDLCGAQSLYLQFISNWGISLVCNATGISLHILNLVPRRRGHLF